VDKIFPPPPRRATTNTLTAATNRVTSTNQPEASPQITPAPSPATVAAPPTSTNLVPADWSRANEETLELSTEKAIYTFTSLGGGLKGIALRNYPESVERRHKARGTNQLATLNDSAPLAALIAVGAEAIQGDGVFQLSRLPDGRSVRAEKTLTNGLRLVKEFSATSNYLVTVSMRWENQSATALAIPATEWIVGTATPMNPLDLGTHVGVDWHNGTKVEYIGEGWFANRTMGCFPGVPRTEYRMGNSNVLWAAVENQFFALAAIPNTPALEIVARRVALPKPTAQEIAAYPKAVLDPHGYQTSVVMPAQTVAAGSHSILTFTLYAGPKEFKTLSRLSDTLARNLDSVMGWDRTPLAGRFAGFFAKLLLLSMNGLQALTGVGYGFVIVIITFIIKMLFWPLTMASTRSMKRMAELSPQMKALQEKYKDDPKKLNQKMMEFWKENKVNPMGGCLPMLLQFPVFIGFFVMIQSAIELRGASFLWAYDLSQPDTVFYIPGLGFIPFLGVPGFGFPVNPLSILMAVTMWYQAQMTPLSPGMDPMQQKMMKYMPLVFVVVLYNYSAALTLYSTTQNVLTIVQTKVTRAKEPAKPAVGPATQGKPAAAPVKPAKPAKKS
jgi:YidC/Oxa1 family membrane protein insertase